MIALLVGVRARKVSKIDRPDRTSSQCFQILVLSEKEFSDQTKAGVRRTFCCGMKAHT